MALLPLSAGYVLVFGFGIVFALLTSGVVRLEKLFAGTRMDSEFFNTAGRSVKAGLTGSVICSQWTWAATILTSSAQAFQYGVSGAHAYAAGAAVQVLLFACLAIQLKRRAPTAHTYLEIVRARWGRSAHLTFLYFALAANILVTAMLILGGGAVISNATGMNLNIASFIMPLSFILYTLIGGLQATFIAGYINTTIIFVVLLIISYTVYAFGEDFGSISEIYHALRNAAAESPIDGNLNGEYLTYWSRESLLFGVVNIIGNFATVFLDQSYWQQGIAARPSATYKGYLLGGFCWFAIPFVLATTSGLAGAALTYQGKEEITVSQANAGLVPPLVGYALLNTTGLVLVIIMLLNAVISTGSAELVSVSSLLSYDVYRTYINPNCNGNELLWASRGAILGFGLFMGVLGIILNEIGLNLGWVYLFMGILIGAGVIPVAMMLTWSKASKWPVTVGPIVATLCGIGVWLVTAKAKYGEVSIDNLGMKQTMLAGNCTSMFLSGMIVFLGSLIFPQNFDFSRPMKIDLLEADEHAHLTEEENRDMERAIGIISKVAITAAIVLVIAWPCLALPVKVFGLPYFTWHVVVTMSWGTAAALLMIFLPLMESYQALLSVLTCGKFGFGMESAKHGGDKSSHKEHGHNVEMPAGMQRDDTSYNGHTFV